MLLLPWEGLSRCLRELRQRHGWRIDSRLQAYASGMDHARMLAVLAAGGGSGGLQAVAATPLFHAVSKL